MLFPFPQIQPPWIHSIHPFGYCAALHLDCIFLSRTLLDISSTVFSSSLILPVHQSHPPPAFSWWVPRSIFRRSESFVYVNERRTPDDRARKVVRRDGRVLKRSCSQKWMDQKRDTVRGKSEAMANKCHRKKNKSTGVWKRTRTWSRDWAGETFVPSHPLTLLPLLSQSGYMGPSLTLVCWKVVQNSCSMFPWGWGKWIGVG